MQNDECRVKCLPRLRRLSFCLLPSAFCLALLTGCSQTAEQQAATTRPANVRERQDRAIKDPFGYSPDMGTTDVSGGGTSGFDRDGFGKDLKNVLDP